MKPALLPEDTQVHDEPGPLCAWCRGTVCLNDDCDCGNVGREHDGVVLHDDCAEHV